MNLNFCPRCGIQGLERLRGYSHCIACSYYPEQESEIHNWHRHEYRGSRICAQRKFEDAAMMAGGDYSSVFARKGVL